MSEENDSSEKRRIQKQIMGRQRKIAMLVQSGRIPEQKQKIVDQAMEWLRKNDPSPDEENLSSSDCDPKTTLTEIER